MTARKAPLRRGWTTGACATAATKAAYTALLTGEFPDPVRITLPRGRTPSFALTRTELGGSFASASVTKDAGDDPDITHCAIITAKVTHAAPGTGVSFVAGPGVGTVTKAGLPLPVGEPAINPVPRRLIRQAVEEVGGSGDVVVEISVDKGAELARHTWNPRLGILGGLSILGTTGVVIPYSCSAWIDSIHRGVDVALAAGLTHVAGCTGSTSEQTVRELYALPDEALLDMGDFAGALVKYVAKHPCPRVTIAGGVGKMSKLADGHLDLHSGRSQVDLESIAGAAADAGAEESLTGRIRTANTALEALDLCRANGIPLGDVLAERAADVVLGLLGEADVTVDVVVIDRGGTIVGRSVPRPRTEEVRA